MQTSVNGSRIETATLCTCSKCSFKSNDDNWPIIHIIVGNAILPFCVEHQLAEWGPAASSLVCSVPFVVALDRRAGSKKSHTFRLAAGGTAAEYAAAAIRPLTDETAWGGQPVRQVQSFLFYMHIALYTLHITHFFFFPSSLSLFKSR